MGFNSKKSEKSTITITLNESLIFQILMLNGLGFILTATLVFLFSDTFFSFLYSLIFGLTAITLLLYFFVKRNRNRFFSTMIARRNDEEKEEFLSVMKIE